MPNGPATRPHPPATSPRRTAGGIARVALLIRSHALPPLSYRVPDHLTRELRVGSAVVAPLSGYGRLGVVVGLDREEDGERPAALKEIRAVAPELSLPATLVALCSRISDLWALPPQTVLRAALPPGTSATAYQVTRPFPEWPWRRGEVIGRSELRRALGAAGSRDAEEEMRAVLLPTRAPRRTVEWAVLEETFAYPPRRAHRQRALVEVLERRGGATPAAPLLDEAQAGRASLRQLVERGAVRLEARREAPPVSYTRGSGAELAPYEAGSRRALGRGGAWVWRVPAREGGVAAAAVARLAASRGRGTLVLAPEVEAVEKLVEAFGRLLPAGLTVAPYHAGLGRRRDPLYDAVRLGKVDVLVGTRAASLLPFDNLGAICIVDEPNEAHRAAPEGHEGVPVHARDLAVDRGRAEEIPVVCLSPTPSLRLYAPESGASRLPPRKPDRWPAIRLVDLRGTGAALSEVLLDACRETLRDGGRVGVIANRLGLATLVSCRRCGHVFSCPACDRPFVLHAGLGGDFLACGNCGRREEAPRECPSCGSDRVGTSGLTVGRVRESLAGALGVEVGVLTAEEKEAVELSVIVGTARPILKEEWDLLVVPDADALLFGAGSVERGFGLLCAAGEASRGSLIAQTRSPEHPAMRAALAGDYESFAAAEVPRRRALGYPPHGHLARITLSGPGDEVRRAVKSVLRPALEPGTEMIGPTTIPTGGAKPGTSWRVLLRGRRREPIARAAALVARRAAGGRGGLRARVEVDPEEV